MFFIVDVKVKASKSHDSDSRSNTASGFPIALELEIGIDERLFFSLKLMRDRQMTDNVPVYVSRSNRIERYSLEYTKVGYNKNSLRPCLH